MEPDVQWFCPICVDKSKIAGVTPALSGTVVNLLLKSAEKTPGNSLGYSSSSEPARKKLRLGVPLDFDAHLDAFTGQGNAQKTKIRCGTSLDFDRKGTETLHTRPASAPSYRGGIRQCDDIPNRDGIGECDAIPIDLDGALGILRAAAAQLKTPCGSPRKAFQPATRLLPDSSLRTSSEQTASQIVECPHKEDGFHTCNAYCFWTYAVSSGECTHAYEKGRIRLDSSSAEYDFDNNNDEDDYGDSLKLTGDRPDHKRVFHNERERCRRTTIRNLFESLRRNVPAVQSCVGTSDRQILIEAANHIESLQGQANALENTIIQMRIENLKFRLSCGITDLPGNVKDALEVVIAGQVPLDPTQLCSFEDLALATAVRQQSQLSEHNDTRSTVDSKSPPRISNVPPLNHITNALFQTTPHRPASSNFTSTGCSLVDEVESVLGGWEKEPPCISGLPSHAYIDGRPLAESAFTSAYTSACTSTSTSGCPSPVFGAFSSELPSRCSPFESDNGNFIELGTLLQIAEAELRFLPVT